jgi:DNA end-binding protein Ku
MPPRSSWKGFVKLSLVSVPVKAYTATSSGGGEIVLNQLHAECNSRVKYQKVCPIHGELANDEIVKGYEFAKGQYAVIDLDELEKLRTESDKSINIDRFVKPSEVDPNFFSGKAYYLTPDGPAGQKPYALLQEAMAEEGLCCTAQIVLFGREQLVLLRPVENLLCMNVLHYASQLKMPAAFQDDLTDGHFSADELKLTKMLVDATVAEGLDLKEYKDMYTERLTQLIESKVAGKEIVSAPEEETPAVINLMDALKASVAQAKAASTARKPARTAEKKAPKKKMAASARTRKVAQKQQKTG